MNNPLNNLSFDPNELIPYTGFNWDCVSGMDDAVKSITKIEQRLVSDLAKRLDKVESSVGRVDTRFRERSTSVIQDAKQVIGGINTRLQNQLSGSLSNIEALTDSITQPSVSEGIQILPISNWVECGPPLLWNGTIQQDRPYQWTLIDPNSYPLTMDKRYLWYVNNWGEIAPMYLIQQVFIPPWDLVITGNVVSYPPVCPEEPPQPPTPLPPPPLQIGRASCRERV